MVDTSLMLFTAFLRCLEDLINDGKFCDNVINSKMSTSWICLVTLTKII